MNERNHQAIFEFGLESKEFYQEFILPWPSSGRHLKPRRITPSVPYAEVKSPLPEMLRTFKFQPEPALKEGLNHCIRRHYELWSEFTAIHGTAAVSKEEFLNFKNTKDSFCEGLSKRLAPVLYFNFVWPESAEHILNAIAIETFQFTEYKGFGSPNLDAWYDILLSHETGVREYKLKTHFVCTAAGTVNLRFWSDNFHPNIGWMSPLGVYVLQITFEFLVNGKTAVCTTERFAIDV